MNNAFGKLALAKRTARTDRNPTTIGAKIKRPGKRMDERWGKKVDREREGVKKQRLAKARSVRILEAPAAP